MSKNVEYYSIDSLAREYDFALFTQSAKAADAAMAREKAAEKRRQQEEMRQRSREEKARKKVNTIVDKYGRRNVILASSFIAMLLITLLLLVANSQKVNDLTDEIKKKNETLTGLEQEYEAMRVSFDSKMSDAVIEEYAINVLGMQHRENNQTEWLNLNNNDIFESCTDKKTLGDSLHDGLAHFLS